VKLTLGTLDVKLSRKQKRLFCPSSLRGLGSLLRASEKDLRVDHPCLHKALQNIYFFVLPANGHKPTHRNSLAVPLMKVPQGLQEMLGVGVFSLGVPTRSRTPR
jgi:hypothetical protein